MSDERLKGAPKKQNTVPRRRSHKLNNGSARRRTGAEKAGAVRTGSGKRRTYRKQESWQTKGQELMSNGKEAVFSLLTSLKRLIKRPKRKKRVLNARSLERQRQVRMMELIGGSVILVGLIVWYCLTAASYREKFLRNTWINGVNVSLMSAEEVEKILQDSVENYNLELSFRGGKSEVLTNQDILLNYVSSGEVSDLLHSQKRMSWLPHKFGKKSVYTVQTSFQFDTARMRAAISAMPEFQESAITKPVDSHIIRQENGVFHVASEVNGNEPDLEQVCSYVSNAVNASVRRLNLNDLDGAYKEPSVKSDDPELNAHADELNAFADRTVSIVRKNSKTTTIGRKQLSGWISYDSEKDYFYQDSEEIYNKCYAVIQKIADEDNDIHTVASFKTTSYGEVVIPCSHYGYELDVGDEAEKLRAVLEDPSATSLTLESFVPETFDTLKDNTYIEVDITDQHVYYYRNGKLEFDTPCVTGQERNVARRTPSGIYSVLALDENVVLGSLTSTDPNQRYESHVNYWMPFFGSYGMHDAEWRDEEEFGTQIYLSYGSHGCVNLPPASAETLFKTIDRYTPVVVFRQGDNAEEGTEKGDLWWNPPADGLYYDEGGDDSGSTES